MTKKISTTPKKTTKCETCKKVLKYTTTKPRFCKVCKIKKAPTKSRKKKILLPKDSKLEIKVKYCLNEIFLDEHYIDNGFYSWLISPKGYPLQLDRFYPELKIAFEVQGRQHFEYEAGIHGTLENFLYMQKCDEIKKQTCKEKKIKLVEIRYADDITKERLKQIIDCRTSE